MHELDPASLLPLLQTERYGRSLDFRASTGSTNDDAKAAASQQAPRGHVVVADSQHKGRGSNGRVWSSPDDGDLYLSIVERPAIAFAQLPPLTLAVGLGVAETVDAMLPSRNTRSQVKWPNDVLVDGKKCAGVLVEATSTGTELQSVVIGIGLNVNRSVFESELTGQATSLRLQRPESGRIRRTGVLAELLLRVEQWVERFATEGPSAVVPAVRERLALLNQPARCGDVYGVVRGVSETGALLMETETGIRALIAGRLLPAES
jgi:BirA family transcriptional regulator, biotin operon repressor / biotin---[acetyl-CoA-carboxylase] ligase